MKITLPNILIGIVCIVVANLLLVLLRTAVTLPFSEGIQSAIASGIGAFIWIVLVNRMNK